MFFLHIHLYQRFRSHKKSIRMSFQNEGNTANQKEDNEYVPSAANLRKLTPEQEAEFHEQFMAECERRWRENVRVELEPFRMLECQRRWLEEEKQKEMEEKQLQEKQQQARQMMNEHIFTYPDGSNYLGQMWEGKKHGKGTLRTAAFVYGGGGANYTSDEAAENGHLVTWNEYIGRWENDKMHGRGCHVRKFGDGSQMMIFEGEWVDGVATEDCVEYD